MIPKDVIDEIFATARIEEVIGEFVQLKRSGSSMKGLSPFVKEKTPSFMVSPAKGIFKDFSSGKGGNVVSFLMEHEAMSYPEALRWLADKYKIEIPEDKATPEEIAQRNQRESLFLINKFALQYFEDSMWDTDLGRAIGLSYFKERGFTEDTMHKFQLGYCLEKGESLHESAKNAGYNLEHLVQLGLIKKNERGYFDFFRGRVMFPIHNLTGRVVGFGGRTLRNDKKIAKYFNSPESEIYNKSKVLYGLHQSKSGVVREDNCLLVEGYTDVISMHQNGVDNVVASSGTALTEDQIRLINRYTQNITILFDGDAAGIKASFRGIDMILEQGMNVRIVLFPDGDDPDSYARAHSEDEIRTFISNNAKDFISFKTDILLREANNDPIKKAKLIKEIVQSIALIPDQITRSVYLKECSDRFEMEEQSLAFELSKLRNKKFNEGLKQEDRLPEPIPPVNVQPKTSVEPKGHFQERDIIRLLLNFGSETLHVEWEDEDGETQEEDTTVAAYIIEQISTDNLSLSPGPMGDIYEVFCQENEKGEVPGVEYFYAHQDPAISSLSVDLCTSLYHLSDNWWQMHRIETKSENDNLQDSILSSVFAFKMLKLDTLIHNSQEKLKGDISDEDMIALLTEQKQYISARKALAGIMNRTILR